jgi:hypothetical protein
MTKEDALKELNNTEKWHDFDYWMMLKLIAMGVSGKELTMRMEEESAIHKVRKARRKLDLAEHELVVIKMRNDGASSEEINKYTVAHHRADLLNDWRSLSTGGAAV